MKIKFLFQIEFYHYLILKIKRFHLLDFLFIDFLTLFILLTIIIFNLLFFFPTNIAFSFPSLNTQTYIIDTVVRTISIFVGIVFSFIILSFNIFFRYFGRFAFLNFFKNRGIKVLLTLFVVSIIFMLYTLSYFKEIEKPDNYTNSLFCISIVFSSVTILSIFPVVIILLRQSQTRGNIKTIIQQLNNDWIISYHENVLWDKSISYKHYDKDPITLLTEIGTAAIKEFDLTTLTTIIDTCEDYITSSIKKGQKENIIEPKELYFEFRKLNLNLFPAAVKERNESALFLLLKFRFSLENIVIKNLEKVNLVDYKDKYWGWSLNFDVNDFFIRAIQFNEDEVCRRIIDNYRDFISEIIKTILPVRKFDYDAEDPYKSMDEISLMSGTLGQVDTILNSLLNSKKSYLFQNISNLYSTLDLIIIDSGNTPKSKSYLLWVINKFKVDSIERLIQTNDLKELPFSSFPFHISSVQAIDNLKNSIPFKGCLRTIDILFVNGKLNNMVLNTLKAITFHLIKKIEEDKFFKDLTILSVEKFDYLRTLITESDNDHKKDIYLKLEKFLNVILDYAFEQETLNEEIIDLINYKLGLFEFKDKFKLDLDKKGFISDESII